MLRGIFDAKDNGHLRIKTFDFKTREIGFGVEQKPVSASLDRFADQKERFHAPICVGRGVTKLGPTLIRVLNCERDSNATRRRAPRDIENVRRNGAHL